MIAWANRKRIRPKHLREFGILEGEAIVDSRSPILWCIDILGRYSNKARYPKPATRKVLPPRFYQNSFFKSPLLIINEASSSRMWISSRKKERHGWVVFFTSRITQNHLLSSTWLGDCEYVIGLFLHSYSGHRASLLGHRAYVCQIIRICKPRPRCRNLEDIALSLRGTGIDERQIRIFDN